MGNNVRWTVCKKYTNEKELVFAPLLKHIIAVLPIFYYFFLLCFVSQLCVIYDRSHKGYSMYMYMYIGIVADAEFVLYAEVMLM